LAVPVRIETNLLVINNHKIYLLIVATVDTITRYQNCYSVNTGNW
jgi:hypothetical protein